MALEPFPNNKKADIASWCKTKVKKIYGKKRREHKFDAGKAQSLFFEFVDKINEMMEVYLTADDIQEIINGAGFLTQDDLDDHEEDSFAHQQGGQPSDRRLKYDVKFVGKSPSGINIYNFRFKDEAKYGKGLYQGVISDEVPESVVVKDPSGYDMVNYGQIDVDFVSINKL